MNDTPANSRFLVISGSSQWWTDRQAEWFPALADRVSVATVQGTEWLTTKPFSDHVSEYNAVQRCAGQTAECLNAWSAKTDTSFDYVYVSKTVPIQASYGVEGGRVDKPHEFVLDFALRSDPHYSLVFENASAAVYKRN